MSTRIRYKKASDGTPESQVFTVIDKRYQAFYYVPSLHGGIKTLPGHEIVASVGPQNNTATIKRKLKDALKRLGVQFDNEVRRKRSQQQAIDAALKEKTNE